MKKFTKKRIKECIRDIELNFSELIDAIIFYEQKDLDDYSYEIIGYLEKLSNEKEFELLIKDFEKRKNQDFENYSYQKLWWALINEKSDFVINEIINYINNKKNGKLLEKTLNNWLLVLDDGVPTKENISDIMTKANKLP